jgi:hypothetical protein
VSDEQPRRGLQRAIDKGRASFSGDQRSQYDRLGNRADDTLTEAVADAFRLAFIISSVLALGAAVAVLPSRARRRALERLAVAAALVPVGYVVLQVVISPSPVKIANPCHDRSLPQGSGGAGVVQDAALVSLDQIACHFGSSREQLVLALADAKEARRYKREHGVDPRKAGNLLQGLIGG